MIFAAILFEQHIKFFLRTYLEAMLLSRSLSLNVNEP